jgi:hypothetical protein
MSEQIKTGDVVKLFNSIQKENGYTLAYVYLVDEERDFPGEYGIWLINSNNTDLGRFNFDYKLLYVERIGASGFEYVFTSFFQLGIDSYNGVFDRIWKEYVPADIEARQAALDDDKRKLASCYDFKGSLHLAIGEQEKADGCFDKAAKLKENT